MSVTPLTRFIRASDIVLKRVASFEQKSETKYNIHSLEIHNSELQKLWNKVHCTYEECKNCLTTSETAQTDGIDVVEEKYATSYIAYLRCISTISRHLERLKTLGSETPSPAVAPAISPPPPNELLFVSKETPSPSLLSSESLAPVSVQSTPLGVIVPTETSSTTTCSTQTDDITFYSEQSSSGLLLRESIPLQVDASHVCPSPPQITTTTNCSAAPIANHSKSTVDTHYLPLPPIDIDVFAGGFMSWPTFRDLFTTLFVEKSRLSDVERLCYLLQKTTGEAREIVSSFPLTNSSFPLAWKALSDTYDNKRIVVNSHIQQLLNLPSLDKETCSGLKTIQRGINGCLAAMTVYDVITDHWDPIVVCICLQRLPKLTLTLWEQSLKNKSSLPSWKDLEAFLIERIQTLTCIQNLYGYQVTKKVVSSRSSNKVLSVHKSNDVSHPRSTNLLTSTCPICSGHSHVLRLCPQFIKLSFEDKFSIVKKHNYCINCLCRGHAVKKCNSKYSCNLCKQRHHSLLHRPHVRRAPATSKLSPSFTDVKSRDRICVLSQPRHSAGISTLPCTSPAFTNFKSRESKCTMSKCTMSTRSPNRRQSNHTDTDTLSNSKVLASPSVNSPPAFTYVKSRVLASTLTKSSPAFTMVKSRVFSPSLSRSNTSPAFTKVKSRIFSPSLSLPTSSPAFTDIKCRELRLLDRSSDNTKLLRR
ncbi:uncharacterized protein [Musca autumnalis]|uniref:uncharacterized protein n=1 Tax=Musca autumnalis TaxID=221902 RepID=UPI003CF3A772